MNPKLQSELGQYLGSETKAAGFVLALIGSIALIGSGFVGVYISEVYGAALAIWAAIALGLGIWSRRAQHSRLQRMATWLWVTPVLGVGLYIQIFPS